MGINSKNNNSFEYYLSVAKNYVLKLFNEKDRMIASKWIEKLTNSSLDEQLREHTLELLLFCLKRKCLVGPFKDVPSPSSSAQENNTLLNTNLEQIKRLIAKLESERITKIEKCIIQEISGNLTEFVSYQKIPDFGAHFYYAYSPEETISEWYNSNEITLPKWYCSSSLISIKANNILNENYGLWSKTDEHLEFEYHQQQQEQQQQQSLVVNDDIDNIPKESFNKNVLFNFTTDQKPRKKQTPPHIAERLKRKYIPSERRRQIEQKHQSNITEYQQKSPRIGVPGPFKRYNPEEFGLTKNERFKSAKHFFTDMEWSPTGRDGRIQVMDYMDQRKRELPIRQERALQQDLERSFNEMYQQFRTIATERDQQINHQSYRDRLNRIQQRIIPRRLDYDIDDDGDADVIDQNDDDSIPAVNFNRIEFNDSLNDTVHILNDNEMMLSNISDYETQSINNLFYPNNVDDDDVENVINYSNEFLNDDEMLLDDDDDNNNYETDDIRNILRNQQNMQQNVNHLIQSSVVSSTTIDSEGILNIDEGAPNEDIFNQSGIEEGQRLLNEYKIQTRKEKENDIKKLHTKFVKDQENIRKIMARKRLLNRTNNRPTTITNQRLIDTITDNALRTTLNRQMAELELDEERQRPAPAAAVEQNIYQSDDRIDDQLTKSLLGTAKYYNLRRKINLLKKLNNQQNISDEEQYLNRPALQLYLNEYEQHLLDRSIPNEEHLATPLVIGRRRTTDGRRPNAIDEWDKKHRIKMTKIKKSPPKLFQSPTILDQSIDNEFLIDPMENPVTTSEQQFLSDDEMYIDDIFGDSQIIHHQSSSSSSLGIERQPLPNDNQLDTPLYRRMQTGEYRHEILGTPPSLPEEQLHDISEPEQLSTTTATTSSSPLTEQQSNRIHESIEISNNLNENNRQMIEQGAQQSEQIQALKNRYRQLMETQNIGESDLNLLNDEEMFFEDLFGDQDRSETEILEQLRRNVLRQVQFDMSRNHTENISQESQPTDMSTGEISNINLFTNSDDGDDDGDAGDGDNINNISEPEWNNESMDMHQELIAQQFPEIDQDRNINDITPPLNLNDVEDESIINTNNNNNVDVSQQDIVENILNDIVGISEQLNELIQNRQNSSAGETPTKELLRKSAKQSAEYRNLRDRYRIKKGLQPMIIDEQPQDIQQIPNQSDEIAEQQTDRNVQEPPTSDSAGRRGIDVIQEYENILRDRVIANNRQTQHHDAVDTSIDLMNSVDNRKPITKLQSNKSPTLGLLDQSFDDHFLPTSEIPSPSHMYQNNTIMSDDEMNFDDVFDDSMLIEPIGIRPQPEEDTPSVTNQDELYRTYATGNYRYAITHQHQIPPTITIEPPTPTNVIPTIHVQPPTPTRLRFDQNDSNENVRERIEDIQQPDDFDGNDPNPLEWEELGVNENILTYLKKQMAKIEQQNNRKKNRIPIRKSSKSVLPKKPTTDRPVNNNLLPKSIPNADDNNTLQNEYISNLNKLKARYSKMQKKRKIPVDIPPNSSETIRRTPNVNRKEEFLQFENELNANTIRLPRTSPYQNEIYHDGERNVSTNEMPTVNDSIISSPLNDDEMYYDDIFGEHELIDNIQSFKDRHTSERQRQRHAEQQRDEINLSQIQQPEFYEDIESDDDDEELENQLFDREQQQQQQQQHQQQNILTKKPPITLEQLQLALRKTQHLLNTRKRYEKLKELQQQPPQITQNIDHSIEIDNPIPHVNEPIKYTLNESSSEIINSKLLSDISEYDHPMPFINRQNRQNRNRQNLLDESINAIDYLGPSLIPDPYDKSLSLEHSNIIDDEQMFIEDIFGSDEILNEEYFSNLKRENVPESRRTQQTNQFENEAYRRSLQRALLRDLIEEASSPNQQQQQQQRRRLQFNSSTFDDESNLNNESNLNDEEFHFNESSSHDDFIYNDLEDTSMVEVAATSSPIHTTRKPLNEAFQWLNEMVPQIVTKRPVVEKHRGSQKYYDNNQTPRSPNKIKPKQKHVQTTYNDQTLTEFKFISPRSDKSSSNVLPITRPNHRPLSSQRRQTIKPHDTQKSIQTPPPTIKSKRKIAPITKSSVDRSKGAIPKTKLPNKPSVTSSMEQLINTIQNARLRKKSLDQLNELNEGVKIPLKKPLSKTKILPQTQQFDRPTKRMVGMRGETKKKLQATPPPPRSGTPRNINNNNIQKSTNDKNSAEKRLNDKVNQQLSELMNSS